VPLNSCFGSGDVDVDADLEVGDEQDFGLLFLLFSGGLFAFQGFLGLPLLVRDGGCASGWVAWYLLVDFGMRLVIFSTKV
jgi:hypothetical protein